MPGIKFKFVIQRVETNSHMDGYVFIAMLCHGSGGDVEVD